MSEIGPALAVYDSPRVNSTVYLERSDGIHPLRQPLRGASFVQAVKRFWLKAFRFSGYATRSEFWWAYLFQTVIGLIVYIPLLSSIISATSGMETDTEPTQSIPVIWPLLALLMVLVFIIPSLSLTWRRFHDAGFSGLFWLLSFIPYVGGLAVLVMMALVSKPENHRPEWNDNRPD